MSDQANAKSTAPAILTVPGLNSSGPAHWQTIWEQTRDACFRVEQRDWVDPDPEEWVATLHREICRAGEPVLLVAHSLGCWAAVQWGERFGLDGRVRAALLVAPCDPERPDALPAVARFGPLRPAPLPFASTVVGSRNDPYATLGRARAFAEYWSSGFVDAGEAGHINAASDLGDWRFGQTLLDDLTAQTGTPALCERHRRVAKLRAEVNALFGPPPVPPG